MNSANKLLCAGKPGEFISQELSPGAPMLLTDRRGSLVSLKPAGRLILFVKSRPERLFRWEDLHLVCGNLAFPLLFGCRLNEYINGKILCGI